jgi:hypothetical protein
MSDQLEQAEADEVWLHNKAGKLMRKVQGDEVDAFCDRVWELISLHNMSATKARSLALGEILGGR